MTAVPRIFDRVLAGVKGQAMKAGGLQAKLVPWALARRAASTCAPKRSGPRAERVARRCSTRSRSGSCSGKSATRWASIACEFLTSGSARAARRYGDDVPWPGRSDHARLRPNRNVAGDVGEPTLGERIRRGRASDQRRRRSHRRRRRDPRSRAQRHARLLSRSRGDGGGDRRRLAAHRRHRRASTKRDFCASPTGRAKSSRPIPASGSRRRASRRPSSARSSSRRRWWSAAGVRIRPR